MSLQDLHTHSVFDDGQNTLAEMAAHAFSGAFAALGFSGHSPLPFENCWSMTEASLRAYRAEVSALQQAYAGRMEIYCGLEYDVLSDCDLAGFDYVIGSVHHLPFDTEIVSVDESPEVTSRWLTERFEGDGGAACAYFYAQYAALAQNPRVDIVGHFDLISKFDEPHALFPDCPSCALAAMEALVAAGKIFEINTGAIARGYRVTPYPSKGFLLALREMGGKICISSDAHSVSALGFGFDRAAALAKTCGFQDVYRLTPRGFAPEAL